jgi:dipeptidyl aminopeptidase/acylaminoacyl peptidase
MQRKIAFKNSKGQRLVGVLHIPKGSGSFPAVIVQHGFKSNHQHILVKAIASKLEQTGFIALRFSFSGHYPSGGGYKDVLVSQFIKDTKQALNLLSKLPQVDKKRIGMIGHSLGAFTALLSAQAFKQKLSAIVSLSSLYDVKAVIKSYYRDKKIQEKGKNYWIISGFKVINTHFQDRKYLQEKYLISDIHCPVLVIHGTADRRVNVKDGRTTYKLLNQPKNLTLIKGADHNFSNLKHAQQVIKLTIDWFIKYLKN